MSIQNLQLSLDLAPQVVHTFKAHEKNVRAMSYDANDQTLVTGSFDRKCQVWKESPPRTLGESISTLISG